LAIHVIQYLRLVLCDSTTEESALFVIWYVRSILFIVRRCFGTGLEIVLVVYRCMIFAVCLAIPVELRRLVDFIWNLLVAIFSFERSGTNLDLGLLLASSCCLGRLASVHALKLDWVFGTMDKA
jgi:hypothetical protein